MTKGLFAGNGNDVARSYDPAADVSLWLGDCRDLLRTLPPSSVRLAVTSPPYNIGKAYEKRTALDDYIELQREVVAGCVDALVPGGSVCWQVGNFVDNGAIVPLDIALYPVFDSMGLVLRNRIIWHFEHGLHCTNRFSGRYEVIMWFTLGDDYFFDVDPIRVPQKYPNKKHFKGPKAGQLSSNPLGKNPGDLWIIPNVKHNHVEKTEHPCQFPVELIERLVLSLTRPDELVLDPFMGVGSAAIAAMRHGRRAAGAELMPQYHEIACERIRLERQGLLRTRPMDRPVYEPREQRSIDPEQDADEDR